jgi:hypothetical protein
MARGDRVRVGDILSAINDIRTDTAGMADDLDTLEASLRAIEPQN